jgi:hypothetical protein
MKASYAIESFFSRSETKTIFLYVSVLLAQAAISSKAIGKMENHV